MKNNSIEFQTISMFQNTFVALDVETTGLSPIINELIEVSAIKYEGAKKVDTFSTLIKPKERIPKKITEITGITNEMVESSPFVEQVMPKLIQFVSYHTIVAHNAAFDMSFLQKFSGGKFKNNEVVDTVELSRQMHPNLQNHKLGTVAKYLGITEDGFHRAEFDCECCARIYMKYLGVI